MQDIKYCKHIKNRKYVKDIKDMKYIKDLNNNKNLWQAIRDIKDGKIYI